MKKGMFSMMNYYLPLKGIASMHCSANTDKNGENTAIFFGLSGTGKTTLSTDPKRLLIGDDEHGWDDNGVFNFEGGCYAKVINLDKESEPDIYNAIRRDALLENVTVDKEGKIDFNDKTVTENTRVSYPIDHIDNIVRPVSSAPAAKNVIFLSADAFGVLPPVSILTPEQTKYYFLSGFTAKLAGTERGITEPTPTFSACFGQASVSLLRILVVSSTLSLTVLSQRLLQRQFHTSTLKFLQSSPALIQASSILVTHMQMLLIGKRRLRILQAVLLRTLLSTKATKPVRLSLKQVLRLNLPDCA